MKRALGSKRLIITDGEYAGESGLIVGWEMGKLVVELDSGEQIEVETAASHSTLMPREKGT